MLVPPFPSPASLLALSIGLGYIRQNSQPVMINGVFLHMYDTLSRQERHFIIIAALLALFLGAMDALIISAAMPTIVAELGGMHLYSWVYSAYFLARAISLPVFGKLADLFSTRRIFLFSVSVFLLSSVAAGAAPSMMFLVGARVFQGIGAGGIFALVYIILSDIALPGERGKTLSFASSVWGISSIIGPTLGGFIVTYMSWRWIFFINLPVGCLCLAGIGFLLRDKVRHKEVHLDIAGIGCLTGFIFSFLMLFIVGGRDYAWISFEMGLLLGLSGFFAVSFVFVEKRAKDPVLDLRFFSRRDFGLGNSATFFSSFAIFSLFAYAPLFIQGALAKTPMQVGLAMLSLSLGWSCGSLFLGRLIDGAGGKTAAVAGGAMLLLSSVFLLFFSPATSMLTCFFVFLLTGLGMGFVTLSTLLLVQASVPGVNLGVATSFHQFARTLGGTVGVGICGGIMTTSLIKNLTMSEFRMSDSVTSQLRESVENIFRPEFQALLTPEGKNVLYNAVSEAIGPVFWIILGASLACLCCSLLLRGRRGNDDAEHPIKNPVGKNP
jgi:EmrB/QacA subfamily drug resistance transporter